MHKWFTLTLFCLALSLSASASAADPELVSMAQKELVALGYDPGNIQGEMSTETVVAISEFQAQNNMEVTGEVTPQLVGALRAAKNKPSQNAAASTAAPATQMTPEEQEADLQARRQACLQEKYAAAQERNKKKRGMMRLLSAVSRSSRQFGSSELAGDISRASWEAYNVNATAADLEAAGKDLGLTPDEMEACRNPP